MMPFLTPKQQCQSTEGTYYCDKMKTVEIKMLITEDIFRKLLCGLKLPKC